MHAPEPVSTSISAPVLALLAEAKDGRLVLCIGAGVSMAYDAGLPSGARLGELLNDRLSGRLQGYVEPEDVQDLIAVADEAFAAAGGLPALQSEVLELACFKTATPNYGHQVLALLLAEGALTALSWNWDSCIERSTPLGDSLQVARTSNDMRNLARPHLAKVHGCATMRPTLLITSAQLAQPPLWTEHAFAERVRSSVLVFVGIGDVADYARRRITELVTEFQPPEVHVVSPNVRTRWSQSMWAAVLPDLPEERRIPQTADEFLDELARAWARELLERARTDANSLREDVRRGVERVVEALGHLSSVNAIQWCRRALIRPETGRSAVRLASTGDAVIAAGVLVARTDGTVSAPRAACCVIGDDVVELLVAPDRTPAADVHRAARRRSEQLANDGQLPGGAAAFLVGGTVMGPLDNSEVAATDVVAGNPDTADVIDGPAAVRQTYFSASALLAEAA